MNWLLGLLAFIEDWPNVPKSTVVVETRFRERCNVGIESKTPVERNAKNR